MYALSGWLKGNNPSYHIRLVTGPKLAGIGVFLIIIIVVSVVVVVNLHQCCHICCRAMMDFVQFTICHKIFKCGMIIFSGSIRVSICINLVCFIHDFVIA